jgi:hypothetical protein
LGLFQAFQQRSNTLLSLVVAAGVYLMAEAEAALVATELQLGLQ